MENKHIPLLQDFKLPLVLSYHSWQPQIYSRLQILKSLQLKNCIQSKQMAGPGPLNQRLFKGYGFEHISPLCERVYQSSNSAVMLKIQLLVDFSSVTKDGNRGIRDVLFLPQMLTPADVFSCICSPPNKDLHSTRVGALTHAHSNA